MTLSGTWCLRVVDASGGISKTWAAGRPSSAEVEGIAFERCTAASMETR